jgi:hypothetical protein
MTPHGAIRRSSTSTQDENRTGWLGKYRAAATHAAVNRTVSTAPVIAYGSTRAPSPRARAALLR